MPDGSVTEGIKVCEINARFPWNGYVALPHTAQVMEEMDIAKSGLKPTIHPVSDSPGITTGGYHPRELC